eukprot:m.406855 g.406855  ORF g.406855 m.406855 type:complete len:581 (-) comp21217_c0_seq1:549-2291(-)
MALARFSPALGTVLLWIQVHVGSSTPTTVKTANGDIVGLERKHFREFRGIPFAEPPIDDLRWRPPQAKKPWSPNVLNASNFKHNCIQAPDAGMGWPQPWDTLSEDCLYLNVYAPPKYDVEPPRSPVPVIFWIYGGGFQGGGGNETRLNGTWNVELLNGEVIIVVPNYRLNVFGFLAADVLRPRDTEALSTGNYGIQDQRMALLWVHDNIAAFGGDPRRVFIVGQSAGANSVSQHLVRPQSWPYFSAAGMESGAFYDGPNVPTVADKAKDFEAFVERVGCGNSTGNTSNSVIDCLVAAPARKIFTASLLSAPYTWTPCVDGVDLVAPGPVLAQKGAIAKVPILAGYVAEDINPGGSNCLPTECNESDFRRWGLDTWGFNETEVDRFVALYANDAALPGGPNTKWDWAIKHAGADFWGGCPSRRIAHWYTQHGQRAYWYKWSYAPMGANGEYPTLAHHACEQPFVFHVLSETAEEAREDKGMYHIEAEEIAFSQAVVQLWSGMALYGAPNDKELPQWLPYSEHDQECLLLGRSPSEKIVHDRVIELVQQQSKAKCDFWDDHFWGPGWGPSLSNPQEIHRTRY